MELVLTPEQMRDCDREAIAAGTSGVDLMELAGHACAVAALRRLGGGYGRRVTILCGKGSNGGDGIVCGRHLAAAGAQVSVVLVGEPTGDAAEHLARARALGLGGLRVRSWPDAGTPQHNQAPDLGPDLVVDALLGTGASGAPRGVVAEAIERIASWGAPVLAVDIPSGVGGADGAVPGAAVSADQTVAIQSLKPGHVSAPGAFRCGEVLVADIGIPVASRTAVPTAADVGSVLPEREPDAHKYQAGAVAVLAGSAGMTGAAVLTARGAIRAGAGLVLLGVPESSLETAEGGVLEAVKVGLPEVEGRLDAKAVDELGDRLERCRALAVGPGIGRGPHVTALVRRALDVDLPLVVDGDGLWALAEVLGGGPDAVRSRRHATVLTPHAGEYAFLAGDPPGPGRIAPARELAERTGAVVHLKGRFAVTAVPDGRAWVNATGGAGAATGGTGDVLTGVVGALVAQGADAATAAWAGAYLHGAAVDDAETRLGTLSVSAGDVADALPRAMRAVSAARAPTGPLRRVLRPA